mmetsp:Transcript_8670/g.14150  ORF Transcript_8670/g.14150 Transcript_8670/m.14150 type:complete len:123 (+) Transcript_8670:498-866(+)
MNTKITKGKKHQQRQHNNNSNPATHPLHGTCTEPNPLPIVLLATPNISKLAPINTNTNRMYNTPTVTLVKKILPTRLVPNFSIFCGKGMVRRRRQNNGMGKKIHIMWPHVIIEPIVVFEICS